MGTSPVHIQLKLYGDNIQTLLTNMTTQRGNSGSIRSLLADSGKPHPSVTATSSRLAAASRMSATATATAAVSLPVQECAMHSHCQGQVQRLQRRSPARRLPPANQPNRATVQVPPADHWRRAVAEVGRRAGWRRLGWEILTIAAAQCSLPWPPSRSRLPELRSCGRRRRPPLPPGLVPRCLKWRRSARGTT